MIKEMEQIQIKNVVEGALFAADEPLSVEEILKLFDKEQTPDKMQIKEVLQLLITDYESRAIELKELASGYQFQVRAELSKWIQRLWEERPARYSRALLETLALIAYRQPITRAEIEEIRGVSVSSQMIRTLMDREWIHIIGHRDVPGKPGLYATTKQFLDYFGLKSLEELPELDEITDLSAMEEKVEEKLFLDKGIDLSKAETELEEETEEELEEEIEEEKLEEHPEEELEVSEIVREKSADQELTQDVDSEETGDDVSEESEREFYSDES